MKIKINSQISDDIQSKRKKLRMTQIDLSDKVGISQQSLQRLESGMNKNCDKEILRKIYQTLDLNWTDVTGSDLVPKSYRLPAEIVDKLYLFQKKKKFSTETEALTFCLNEFFTNDNLRQIRIDFEEFLENTIVKTFIKEMKKMGRSMERYEAVLKMIEADSEVDSEKYFNQYDEELYKRVHAERMK